MLRPGKLICLVAFLFWGGKCFASIEPYFNSLTGAQVAAGSSFSVTDDKFRSMTSSQWGQLNNITESNVVTFELNFDTSVYFYNKPFSCTLNATIHFYANQSDTTQETSPAQTINLTIRYDTTTGKPYTAIALYRFSGAFKFTVVINSISSPQLGGTLPNIFRVTGQTVIDRKYAWADASTDVTNFKMLNAQQLQINWTPANYPGAESYDLEWTVIDSLSQMGYSVAHSFSSGNVINIPSDTLNLWFTNNSTRINTTNSTYILNLPYDAGYLLYRIRGVQIHYPDSLLYEGQWNYQAEPAGSSSAQSAAVAIPWHERGLNWQYSASFAEQGKKKEVVQYFDGTQRNRQSVTLNNSDNVSVVQETMYDNQGRAALSVLPAPAPDTTLHYFRDFNLNTSGQPYTFSDFAPSATCQVIPTPMSLSAGAANYYSPSNPFPNSIHQAYIPNAHAYPFSVTQYTPDNTGRVLIQGGVDTAFQPGHAHTTVNYYGKPLQVELDRLFGSEAGVSTHFLKNMVVDPNGQVSVTYVDANGKTVATALGGRSPVNLDSLPSTLGAITPMSEELLRPENFTPDVSANSLSATTTFLAPMTGTYQFKYEVDPLALVLLDGLNNQGHLCSSCYYDLNIHVKDDCNNILFQVSTPAGQVFDTTCGNQVALINTFSVPISTIGEYYVDYSLTISKNALNYYDSVNLVKNTNIQSFDYFLLQELNKQNFQPCFANCSDCLARLGAPADFLNRFKPLYLSDSASFGPADSIYVVNLYQSLLAQCQANQNSGSCAQAPCNDKFVQLMADVSPGGQYALYDSNYNIIGPASINVLSKYTQVKSFPDANGNPDSVKVASMDGQDSVTIPVNQLSLKQFIQNFKNTWADSLVQFHPEYCYYLWCAANSNYYAFDASLQLITDGDSAISKGYYSMTDYAALLEKDPYFSPANHGGDSTLYKEMQDSLLFFSRSLAGYASPDLNIQQVIKLILYCGGQASEADTCNVAMSCRSPYEEWNLYLQLYGNLKTEFYEFARLASPQFANCSNCHIGSDGSTSVTITPVAPASYITVTPPNCSTNCPGGIYVPTNRKGVSYYIEYGTPSTTPTDLPGGYGALAFHGTFSNGSGSPTNPAFGCTFNNVWVAELDTSCCPSGYPYTGPCICTPTTILSSHCTPVTAVDSALATKTRIFPEYVNPGQILQTVQSSNPQQLLQNNKAQLAQQGDSLCNRQAYAWIQALSRCSANTTLLNQLQAALAAVCSGGYDSAHANGASSLAPGATGPDSTFEAAITRILGAGALNDSCTSELINSPYPYNHQPVLQDPLITKTNADICNQLGLFRSAYAASGYGGTLQQYLQQQLGQDYALTLTQLNDLINSCTNCNGALQEPLLLPQAFVPGSLPGVSCTTLQTMLTAFQAKFPNLHTTDYVYDTLFTNYFNHRLGYTLTFLDYQNFMDSCGTSGATALLYNQPASPQDTIDDNSCVEGLFANAQANAFSRYTVYVDSVHQAFREAYLTRCMGLQPTLNMNANLYEYHYTLYYYDQSGNLVKTIPPAGVQLLDTAQTDSVALDRSYNKSNCYEYADELQFDGAGSMSFADQPNFYSSNNPFTLEAYLRFPSAGNQGILSHFDPTTKNGGHGYQLLLRNDSLVFRMAANDTSWYEAVTAPIESITSYNTWVYVAIERFPSADSTHQVNIFINGNQYPVVYHGKNFYQTSSIDPPIASALLIGAEADSLGKHYFNGRVKQFRFYNRDLPWSEIMQNNFNACLMPASQNALATWAPMGEGTGDIVDILHRDTATWTETAVQPGWINRSLAVYPKHTLATNYQFSSIDQVILKHTPDADTSWFWYDRLARLAVSQNKEQYKPLNQGAVDRFSYTLYDPLNRIIEMGEKSGSPDIRTVNTLDTNALNAWQASGSNGQVTRTVYDAINSILVANTGITSNQQNLRKRVVSSLYYTLGSQGTYDEATHFSYDINGNVQTLWQEISQLSALSDNGIKRLDYYYDLVSGKVNQLTYQAGKGDQFIYSYTYDADNRLTGSYTSRDNVLWTQDATYRYYLHGPLARMELGQYKVQGVDYAYTIQGWLKSINGHHLLSTQDTSADMNQDGWANTPYSTVSRDAYAVGLGYYPGDYDPIGGVNAKAQSVKYNASVPGYEVMGNGLFNGNISYSTLALSRLDSSTMVGYTYRYDQLNRLIQMRKHGNIAGSVFTWDNTSIINDYKESVSYDPNGNIQTYLRNGTIAGGSQLAMDQLGYTYQLNTNRLDHITDAVPSANYSTDIDNQSAQNYGYDQIGNLIVDNQSQVANVQWTLYGKISQILETLIGTNLSYFYNPAGERIYKHLTTSTANKKEFYIRDAQGNTLAIYGNDVTAGTFTWAQQSLYGSSRLGVWQPNGAIPAPVSWLNVQDSLQIGQRAYELTNQLGNVLGSISDKKIGMSSNDTLVNYYVAEVLSQSDYYPFGMQIPGRNWNAGSYRYGFNGKENDNEIKGVGDQQDYGMRIYDPRVGRFLSVDPVSNKYPELTPYQFASNRPIDGIDLDGKEYMKSIPKFDYTGSLTDYVSAVDNGVINVLNLVPDLWNSGVATYQALGRGTYLHDLGSEFKQDGKDIKSWAVGNYNYTVKTPFLTQLKDAGKTLIAPQTVETLVTLYVGSKIPLGGGKGNLLKVEKAVTSDILTEGESLASKYANARPKFRTGVIEKVWKNAMDDAGNVYDPHTEEQLTWDKTKARRGQWDMGHVKGASYKQLVEDLRTGKINQKQFLDEYNNPDNYKPESPSENRSRKHD